MAKYEKGSPSKEQDRAASCAETDRACASSDGCASDRDADVEELLLSVDENENDADTTTTQLEREWAPLLLPGEDAFRESGGKVSALPWWWPDSYAMYRKVFFTRDEDFRLRYQFHVPPYFFSWGNVAYKARSFEGRVHYLDMRTRYIGALGWVFLVLGLGLAITGAILLIGELDDRPKRLEAAAAPEDADAPTSLPLVVIWTVMWLYGGWSFVRGIEMLAHWRTLLRFAKPFRGQMQKDPRIVSDADC